VAARRTAEMDRIRSDPNTTPDTKNSQLLAAAATYDAELRFLSQAYNIDLSDILSALPQAA
jgi:hypothetical protein